MHRQGASPRTCFQENQAPDPAFDLKTDIAIAYGLDDTLARRCAAWKALGYVVHVMTGVAWSEDQRAYVSGAWDGRTHEDERQQDRDGRVRWHHPGVAYMVPTAAYGRYRAEMLRLAVDAGVEALHLEEPEFWVSTGYSPAFRRWWQERYGDPWQDPASSAAARWKSGELKAHAYLETLTVLCRDLKAYARERYGRDLRFYVPTHSLINYSQWGIVSPESRLLEIPGCDGYIAQVWTGTARTPNRYRGVRRERTFETAFLEYGAMADLVRGTDHRLWLLHDPVEDDPHHHWDDYRANWRRTVVASLFQTHVADFEVAPWPHRVFLGRYPASTDASGERLPLSAAYRRELLGVMNALADMDQPDADVAAPFAWGSIGVAISDAMMNQRGYPGPADLEFDAFYGQALPLVKAGVPLRMVQLDHLGRTGHLTGLRLLVLSYALQKPAGPFVHEALAAWVRGGGALLLVGDGSDAFAALHGWWHDAAAETAEAHLWDTLGLAQGSDGSSAVACGAGWVARLALAPEACARSADGAARLLEAAAELARAAGLHWGSGSAWVARRGPYRAVAVLDEVRTPQPLCLHGWYVDLFDAGLALRQDPVFQPGDVGLLVNLAQVPHGAVAAAQARVEPVATADDACGFRVGGPSGGDALVRLRLDGPPRAVVASGPAGERPLPWLWHAPSRSVAVTCPVDPAWTSVVMRP